MFRFIHSSDLHLGKPFGRFDDLLRGRLTEARHGVIGRLADAARGHRAAHVLLAGDIFDGAFVSAAVRTQAVAAMSAARDLTWWLLPGNHDPLAAEPLWAAVRREAGPGVRVLDAAVPLEMASGVTLLPAPVAHRSGAGDPTAWMAQVPQAGGLRIGLAHGGVVAFGTATDQTATIPPDRAQTARLDYLALGDWHGQRPAGPSAWYAGTPERDSFRHDGPGAALAVTLAPGALPEVTPVPTGAFDWRAPELRLVPAQKAAEALAATLPGAGLDRRHMLVRLTVSGTTGLPEQAALTEALAEAAPHYAHLEARMDALTTEATPEDLDGIAAGGALRVAAESLLAESRDPARPAPDRAEAAAALNRLYSLVRAEAAE